MSVSQHTTQRLSRRLASRLSQYATGGGAAAWAPTDLANLAQLYEPSIAPYYAPSTLNGLKVLRSDEAYGSFRLPRQGRCANLDGTDDYAVSTIPAASYPITLAGRTINTAVGRRTLMALCSSGTVTDYVTLEQNSTSIEIHRRSVGDGDISTTISSANLNDGANHHVAVVFHNATSFSVYIDGVLEGLHTVTSVTLGSLTRLAIGVFRVTSPSGYFSGKLFDMRYYNVDKDASAIAAIAAGDYDAPDTVGRVAHWWLNEESGTTHYDVSGDGNHLTATGITESTYHATDTGITYNPANGPDGHSKALVFDGTNHRATLKNQITIAEDFTVGFFIKPQSVTGAQVIFGDTSNGDIIYQSTTGLIIEYNGVTTTNIPVGFAIGQWVHIAVVRNSADLVSVYKDGVFVGSGTVAPTFKCSQIGARNTTTPSLFLNGSLEDVRIYDVEKNTSEITAIATGTADTTNLLVQYLMKGESTTVADESGNSNTLTLVNGPYRSIIPAVSSTTDAIGNPLTFVDDAPNPHTYQRPVLTGDGTALYADLGVISGDYDEYEIDFYTATAITAASSGKPLIGTSSTSIIPFITGAYSGGLADETVLIASNGATAVTYIKEEVPVGWNHLKAAWNGSSYDVFLNGTQVTTYSGSTHAAKLSTQTIKVLSYSGVVYGNFRVANLAITTGGVTTTFALEEGAGRDLAYTKSDNTYGIITGAIVNGTTSAAWANRSAAMESLRVNNGGLIFRNQLVYSEDLTQWTDGPVLADTANTLTFTSAGQTMRKYQWIGTAATGKTYTGSVTLTADKDCLIAIYAYGAGAMGFLWGLTGFESLVAGVPKTLSRSGTAIAESGYAGAILFGLSAQSLPGGATVLTVEDFQFEEGSVATTYQPTTTKYGIGQFVPATDDSSICANGLPVELGPGNTLLDNATQNFNPFSAAGNNNLYLPTAYPSVPCFTGVSGANNYIDTGETAFDLDTSWTVSLNVNVQSFANNEGIIGNRQGGAVGTNYWQLTLLGTGHLRLYAIGSSGLRLVDVAISADTWYSVVINYNATTKIFSWTLDGVSQSSLTALTTPSASGRNIYLLKESGYAKAKISKVVMTAASGVVTRIPLSDGAGSSIAKFTDGVLGVAGTIGGTLTSVWANTTPITNDPFPYDLQGISPANSKFRRLDNDGANADDGVDRIFTTEEALTGTDLTNAESYTA